MISQVACVPRICQSCRQGLLLRRNPTFGAARFFHPDTVLQRRGNDPSAVQSKARIEALISGKTWEEDKPSRNARGSRGRKRGGTNSSVVQSKARIEALISGKAWEEDKPSRVSRGSRGKKRQNTPKSRGTRDDELPDWGLTSEQKKPVGEEKRNSRDRDGEISTLRGMIHGQLYDLTPTLTRSKNMESWIEHTPRGSLNVEEHRIPEGKSTTNVEENRAPKIREIITGAKEYENFESNDKIIPTDTKPLEDDRPSNNETVLGHALESSGDISEDVSSNSLGFTPGSISISEPETSITELVSTAQVSDDGTTAEKDEAPASLEEPRSHAKRDFKHELLQKQSISIAALGEDISALVLPNPDKLKRKTNPIVSLPRDRRVLGSALDWESLLDDTDSLEDISVQVKRNIEEFRPKDSSVKKAKDFKKLIRALVDGFTKDQLTAYFRQTLEISNRAANETPKYPWLVKETAWVPSNSEILGVFSPKQKVAYLILKDAWALDIQEQVEGLGAVFVTLRPDVFDLISNPSTGALEFLQSGILDESNNEDIIADKKNELHIYARKASVRTIMSRIDEAVASMRTQELSVKGIDSLDLHKDVLARLSSITRTSIQYHKEDSILNVKWLDQYSPAANTKPAPNVPSLQIENPPDVVLRLLLQDRHIRDGFKSTSDYCTLPPSKTGMFMPHGREVRSLSWRNKMRTWYRYVMPVGKPSPENPTPLKLSSSKRLLRRTSKLKTDGAQVRFSATFGHILHSDPVPSSSSRKKTTGHRVLLPVLPHPAAFTRLIGPERSNPPINKSSSIVLNFIPTQHDSKAPEVRLSLPVNADDDFSNFTMSAESKLYAISPIHQQDFSCPRESVDVRVNQQSELPLDLAKQSHIRGFFDASEFNLVEGRLRTPSHTQISLPSKLLLEPSKGKKATSEVAYTFAGLEIHQTMDLQWHNHILRYNSIEAGQHGGTRQELSLQAVQDPKGPTSAVHRAQFLHAVTGIISGKYFSWEEGYKAIRKLPEEHELDSEQNQDYGNAKGLKVDTPTLHVDDAWSRPTAEGYIRSAESTSIHEQCDRTLESGEELSIVIRQVLSGEEGLQSTRYTNQGEDAIRAGEKLVSLIEETLAQEAPPLEGSNIPSDDHPAAVSAIDEAEDVIRTTEHLTASIEDTVLKQPSRDGMEVLVQEVTPSEGRTIPSDDDLTSNATIDKAEDVLRTTEQLTKIIEVSLQEQNSRGSEDTQNQETGPSGSDRITSDGHSSSTFDEVENAIRTAEQLATVIEEAVEKQKSHEGVDGREMS
ncbi:unnamed protein product [Clonostachys rosea]|uniref:Uncharacterized protein n=1 Tax=Bionectria ochroleuca TaxID=29856 RepID=A0ABY6UPU1_BIOOC|nr:unnamed protein product [Clonostachys rosea]